MRRLPSDEFAIVLVLAAAVLILFNVVFAIAGSSRPGLIDSADRSAFVKPDFAVGTVIAASALNGFFEELFLCGYVIPALK